MYILSLLSGMVARKSDIILQVCGLFLAFATRKVKIKGLDDAKWIAATIYITSIVLAITILSVYTLSDYINRHSAVFTSGLFIGTTFIMGFVFVSKVYTYNYTSTCLEHRRLRAIQGSSNPRSIFARVCVLVSTQRLTI